MFLLEADAGDVPVPGWGPGEQQEEEEDRWVEPVESDQE